MSKKIGKKIGKKLSKVTPRLNAPNQVGTVEVFNQTGIFGPRIARIRTDAEAAIPVEAGTALAKLVGDICREPGLPPHGTGNLEISLARNREVQQRMIQRAQIAAETVWPGFDAMMRALIERETEFVRALGTLGQGVA